jgi:hypothetical protein
MFYFMKFLRVLKKLNSVVNYIYVVKIISVSNCQFAVENYIPLFVIGNIDDDRLRLKY